jgi:hypothetical protein
MTRLLLAAAALAAIPTFSNAQQLPVGYLEGAIGVSLVSDFTTNPFAATIPGYGDFVGHVSADYETEFSGGAEIGLATGRWRFGASWDFSNAQLDVARINGTLDGLPVNAEIPDDDVEAFGVLPDKTINVFAGNIYFNAGAPDWTVRPFVGLGVGAALVEGASTELAATATIGARIALGPRSYIGGRYRLTRIIGPVDDLGANYDEITLHTFSLLLGMYFGG